MNISHVIHPEVLLNQRGPEFIRKLTRDIQHSLVLIEGRWNINYDRFDSRFRDTFRALLAPGMSDCLLEQHLLFKKFTTEKRDTYYLPTEFCEALSSVQKDLSRSYLPDNFLGYMVFPKDKYRNATGAPVNGAYVYVGGSKYFSGSQINAERMIVVVLISNLENLKGPQTVVWTLPLVDNLRLSEIADVFARSEGNSISADESHERTLINILLNAVLYIHFEDSRILTMRSGFSRSHSDRAKLKMEAKGYGNLCTVRMKLLSFDYHRPTVYSMSKTSVSSYWRWQRCGPSLSQLRLRFIREHERHYKTREDCSDNEMELEIDH